jgi:hypothetical protein
VAARPKDSGIRTPVHPKRIRDGQVFAPLHGRHHLRATVRRVKGEWVRVVREDGNEGKLALDRLLASDREGKGVHYRFCGWHPRPRGYRTELRVLGVVAAGERCVVSLPEWNPVAEIEQPLSILPERLRSPGALGSCMANLASPSAAGLAIHNCRAEKAPAGSRHALGPHPDILAAGQRYRRRRDGAAFRLLEPTPAGAKAWNGRRVVSLHRDRLLATRRDGTGRYYEYIGGGSKEARRRRGNDPLAGGDNSSRYNG